MSTRSSTRNLFPPLEDPKRTIRRRALVDPNLLNNFEEINMAANENGDDGLPPAGAGLPVPDLRTMEELCQPSLNGRGGPIAPIAIQATNFGLKNDMIQQVQNSCPFRGPGDDANKHLDKFLHVTQSMKVNGVSDDALRLYLFPYSLQHRAAEWFDRLPRNSITTFDQMAKIFLGKYFPPSMVTKLRNDITNFRQEPDESLFEAWERYNLSIDRCPNHNMLPMTQIDTFYNGLTLRHRNTINAAAGGTFMKRRPEECYDLIENMTAHHNDWDTLAQRSESSSSITSSNPEIVALKLKMAEINKNLMKMLQTNQQVNSVTSSCETCGGPHAYNDCPATVGQTQNVMQSKARFGWFNAKSKKMRKSMLKQEFSEFRIREVEELHKGYDRMQKILSQLNQLKAKPEVALTLKTKGGLELLSFDDLYYKLKTLEVDIKGYSTFSSSQSAGPSHSAFIGKIGSGGDGLKMENAMLSVSTRRRSNVKVTSKEATLQRMQGQREEMQAEIFLIKIQEIGKKEEDSKLEHLIHWLIRTKHDDQSDGVLLLHYVFGYDCGCDTEDAIEEGAAKIYNLITRADTKEASTAGDAGEFALMGVTSKALVNTMTLPIVILVDISEPSSIGFHLLVHTLLVYPHLSEAEIESNVGTPIQEPIIVQDLPSFSCNSSDKNENTSRTSCNKNGYFNKKAGHFRKNASSVSKLCFDLYIVGIMLIIKSVCPQDVLLRTGQSKHSPVDYKTSSTGKHKVLHQFLLENPYSDAEDEGIFDSGCSRSMTGNMERLDDFQEFQGGKVTFGGGKGTTTIQLVLHLHICDKKNIVLFIDTDCLVLSKDFMLPDEVWWQANTKLLYVAAVMLWLPFHLKLSNPMQLLAALLPQDQEGAGVGVETVTSCPPPTIKPNPSLWPEPDQPRDHLSYTLRQQIPLHLHHLHQGPLKLPLFTLVRRVNSLKRSLQGTLEVVLRICGGTSWSESQAMGGKIKTKKRKTTQYGFRTAYKNTHGVYLKDSYTGKRMSSTDLELEHKAYWALKHVIFDILTAAVITRKFQLNEDSRNFEASRAVVLSLRCEELSTSQLHFGLKYHLNILIQSV
ncbi:reverse transcriptase domain-containing protein [Tanacetum coccineum]|uniref:Reverse transcriptase domain-containing protein n=1 Tax=Tanacetum coccineum TaxID=301880 RepID=A0ABQ5HBN1_9ASTR